MSSWRACPVGGAQPNPVMLYANLDRGSLRYGRIDEPGRPFLLTLKRGDLETLEVHAHTTRFDVSWWLELDVRADHDSRVVRVDDGGKPFRTSAPPPVVVAWERSAWRARPDFRQVGELPK